MGLPASRDHNLWRFSSASSEPRQYRVDPPAASQGVPRVWYSVRGDTVSDQQSINASYATRATIDVSRFVALALAIR